jgi:hypothetical protein
MDNKLEFLDWLNCLVCLATKDSNESTPTNAPFSMDVG